MFLQANLRSGFMELSTKKESQNARRQSAFVIRKCLGYWNVVLDLSTVKYPWLCGGAGEVLDLGVEGGSLETWANCHLGKGVGRALTFDFLLFASHTLFLSHSLFLSHFTLSLTLLRTCTPRHAERQRACLRGCSCGVSFCGCFLFLPLLLLSFSRSGAPAVPSCVS